MLSLTEQSARTLLTDTALTAARPGLVGATLDLALPPAALPSERTGLRHGFLSRPGTDRVTLSEPPSPGLESLLTRTAEDLGLATVHFGQPARATGGILVAVEAGTEARGLLGLHRRWVLAHGLAPVLAAAFANTPLTADGRPSGFRSARQAARVLPRPSGDPRADWADRVLDAAVAGTGGTMRDWTRRPAGSRPGITDLTGHRGALRPPVAARGHLELDVADQQDGTGWRLPIAVVTALLDEPRAAVQALGATEVVRATPGAWDRAARLALTDPMLARAARLCFVAAYEALTRWGVSRTLRNDLAAFMDGYVMRGRCPADDILDRAVTG